MIPRRTKLLGLAISATVAMTLTPVAASAWWREPGDAFGRLACWYGGGSSSGGWAKGPGPTFGYGYPSCWDEATIRKYRHHLTRRSRVAAKPAAAPSKAGESKPDESQSKPAETPNK